MMKAQDLKNSILQMAMEGKLVPQDPNDEPASVLLDKIREEKEKLIKEKKIKRNNKESFIFRKNGHFYEKIGKKGEAVCIDDKIPFEVPDNWELCRLENLCSLLNPKIVENGKYPYLNAKFLRNKTDPEIKEKGRFIEINTKVILVDGENSGEVFLTHEDGYMGSTFRLLDINSQIYDKYILKLIELWRNPLKKSKKGAAIPHLNKDIFNNIFVGIPPLNEQKRIVNQINSLMPLIIDYEDYEEKLDKLNSEFLDKLKSSILQEAIQGKLVPQDPNDEPASALLEKIRDEKERLIKEKKIKRNKKESFIFKENNHFYEKIGNNEPVCIDNEIPFNVPNSWEWVRLDSICKYIQRGKSPKYSEIKKYPVVAQKCNQWSGFSLEKAKFIDPKTVDSYKEERILQNKDIMWNSTGLGTLGRVGLYDESVNKYGWAVADSHVTIIRPFAEYILQEFIYLFIASPTVQLVIESKAGGSTKQKELNLSTIKNYLIPIAPYNEQKRIIGKVHKLNKIITLNNLFITL